MWLWPLLFHYPEVPIAPHPGAFGAVRKHDVHSGVDLYAPEKAPVRAVEDGVTIAVLAFTGPEAESPWWLPTSAVLVNGRSGVVLYGEVRAKVRPGEQVEAGEVIGTVQRVLPTEARSEIPGHLPSMLHLELYEKPMDPVWWRLGMPRPKGLLDPTTFLNEARR